MENNDGLGLVILAAIAVGFSFGVCLCTVFLK